MRIGMGGAALIVAAMTSSSCTGIMGLGATSIDASTPGTDLLESDLFTTVVLVFAPIDVFLGVMLVVNDGEISSLERYLEEHRQPIRVALVRGEGAFVRDLAQGFGMSGSFVEPLGDALRAHREALEAPLVEPGPIDRARALRFLAALRDAVQSDPLLAGHTPDVVAR